LAEVRGFTRSNFRHRPPTHARVLAESRRKGRRAEGFKCRSHKTSAGAGPTRTTADPRSLARDPEVCLRPRWGLAPGPAEKGGRIKSKDIQKSIETSFKGPPLTSKGFCGGGRNFSLPQKPMRRKNLAARHDQFAARRTHPPGSLSRTLCPRKGGDPHRRAGWTDRTGSRGETRAEGCRGSN